MERDGERDDWSVAERWPMLCRDEIRARVGAVKYDAVCSAAWNDARRERYGQGAGTFHSDLPHEISDYIWFSESSKIEQIDLFAQIYKDMPCYGNLMYAMLAYRGFDERERKRFWTHVRQWIASDEPGLANPVLYCLWCDFFEDPRTVEESWAAVTASPMPDVSLQRILAASGPVPWKFKVNLYEELLSDPNWHPFILKSLLSSKVDAYGDINEPEAKRILARLDLPDDMEDLQALKQALGGR